VKKGLSFFQLTLDAGLQIEIKRLFNGFSGTLILLDLPENSILAAYSQPGSPGTANAVFSEAYEPGSIVKIISLLAYLRQTDQSVFPCECPGQITMGKRVFYDGIAHKQVNDYSTALAISCNISFAKMGLKIGFQRLAGLLELFYFNAPPFADWFMNFQTGSFKKELRDDFELANLAVGLDEISLTTVHAAMLAAVFSQNGLSFPPYLIDDAKSILNLGYYSHRSRPLRVLADDLNFRRVKKAMQAVLNSEDATSRRAMPVAMDLVIKTGIAGDPKQGLDALAIGFFPAEKPRYAFAFRLEGAGKAELNGAYFLRGLVKILQEK
jgi:peptidoglycan glycosyltransferase